MYPVSVGGRGSNVHQPLSSKLNWLSPAGFRLISRCTLLLGKRTTHHQLHTSPEKTVLEPRLQRHSLVDTSNEMVPDDSSAHQNSWPQRRPISKGTRRPSDTERVETRLLHETTLRLWDRRPKLNQKLMLSTSIKRRKQQDDAQKHSHAGLFKVPLPPTFARRPQMGTEQQKIRSRGNQAPDTTRPLSSLPQSSDVAFLLCPKQHGVASNKFSRPPRPKQRLRTRCHADGTIFTHSLTRPVALTSPKGSF